LGNSKASPVFVVKRRGVINTRNLKRKDSTFLYENEMIDFVLSTTVSS
jgi:hypothetical protein